MYHGWTLVEPTNMQVNLKADRKEDVHITTYIAYVYTLVEMVFRFTCRTAYASMLFLLRLFSWRLGMKTARLSIMLC